MSFFRAFRKRFCIAAVVLMAMQLFGSAMTMARDLRAAAMQAQGKQIVICSVHGTMVIDWDGPLPTKKPARGCPFCLSAASAAAAKVPEIVPVIAGIVMPVPIISGPADSPPQPIATSDLKLRPASPRAPPASSI